MLLVFVTNVLKATRRRPRAGLVEASFVVGAPVMEDGSEVSGTTSSIPEGVLEGVAAALMELWPWWPPRSDALSKVVVEVSCSSGG